MTFSLSRMASAVKSPNDSAQSPACNRNARPACTSASVDRSCRASPAKTSGGSVDSCFRTRSKALGSGHSGCWAAGCSRHTCGVHSGGVTSPAWSLGGAMAKHYGLCLAGSGAAIDDPELALGGVAVDGTDPERAAGAALGEAVLGFVGLGLAPAET